MELNDAERCCCVVTISKAAKKSVSCSGIIVHPQSGTIICTGLPFSRFTSNKKSLNTNSRVISPHRFSKKLKIRVTFCPQLQMNQCAQVDGTYNNFGTSYRESTADLLMLVNCMEFRQAFLKVFPDAHQWRFHGDEEEEELIKDAQFLSWFAILRAKNVPTSSLNSYPGLIPWQSSSSVPKGCPVVACGTPFGSLCLDLFTSTLSRGIISNLTGQENAIILTDARCLPGTEGGGVFAFKNTEKVRLIGVIVSPFGWKGNEWIGLSLVCSVHVIFKNIMQCLKPGNPLEDVVLREKELCMAKTAQEATSVRHPTVCLVDSGQLWGSGVLVTPHLALTCRHVVNGKATVTMKFHQGDRFTDVVGDVLFSSQESSPFDLSVVKLRETVSEAVVPKMTESFSTGEPVLVVGFGAMGRTCGPSLTSGVLSKSISSKNHPVMIQTTCAVQAGTSGGAVVQPHSGELLGIVSSNTKDFATNVTYPHLNFSVPVSVFIRLLQEFENTQDVTVFKELDTEDEDVRRVWRLQIPNSKL